MLQAYFRGKPKSRSTWACELKLWSYSWQNSQFLTSRSTWACELKSQKDESVLTVNSSRSTWACELKWCSGSGRKIYDGHAPRERVSWNQPPRSIAYTSGSHAPRERVSWNGDLVKDFIVFYCHAPRERVSWNNWFYNIWFLTNVTLHVSVWVEIMLVLILIHSFWVTLHVSVWVEMQAHNI